MGVFKHVLVATDFSEASAAAVALAISVAREHGAALTLVNVCELPVIPEALPPMDLITPLSHAAAARLATQLAEVRRQLPAAVSLLKLGSPWEEIVAAVPEAGADLVVIGTHGRRGFAHAMLGSVAERVVRLSPVPVLTVRSPTARPTAQPPVVRDPSLSTPP